MSNLLSGTALIPAKGKGLKSAQKQPKTERRSLTLGSSLNLKRRKVKILKF